jgi:hypothetical protein
MPSTELKRVLLKLGAAAGRLTVAGCGSPVPLSGCETSTDLHVLCETWAQRLKRVFAIDIERCWRCGGTLKVIASIEEPEVIARILAHLGRDEAAADPAHSRQAKRRRRPSRGPPEGRLPI